MEDPTARAVRLAAEEHQLSTWLDNVADRNQSLTSHVHALPASSYSYAPSSSMPLVHALSPSRFVNHQQQQPALVALPSRSEQQPELDMEQRQLSSPSSSASASPPPAPAVSTKRKRSSTKVQTNGKQSRSNSLSSTAKASPQPTIQRAASATAQTLLSEAQKKANHVASEQRRRANIRDAYESLCAVVPALSQQQQDESEAEDGAVSQKKRRRSSRARNSTAGNRDEEMDELEEEEESTPQPAAAAKKKSVKNTVARSEVTVLTQTVDYLNQLTARRQQLLESLNKAQS